MKSLATDISNPKKAEVVLASNLILREGKETPEKILVEDLAALEDPSETTILNELKNRMELGLHETFVGDILLSLNSNEPKEFGEELHEKYKFKSRSDNSPHIFSVADNAYQEALHHVVPQTIILTGESGSGKSLNRKHLLDHLLYLGYSKNINSNRIKSAVSLIESFISAYTPMSRSSTRCLFKTELFFGRTGKVSAASYNVQLVEKWRVSSTDMWVILNVFFLVFFIQIIKWKRRFE